MRAPELLLPLYGLKMLRTAALILFALSIQAEPIAKDSGTEIDGAVFAVPPAACVNYFDPDGVVCAYVTYLGSGAAR